MEVLKTSVMTAITVVEHQLHQYARLHNVEAVPQSPPDSY